VDSEFAEDNSPTFRIIGFFDGFIDELELINISQEETEVFKKKCKWVE